MIRFQVSVELGQIGKSMEDLHMHFPITIATVPFRIPNSNQPPAIRYGKYFPSISFLPVVQARVDLTIPRKLLRLQKQETIPRVAPRKPARKCFT